jgi:5-methylcytosine-specific restriction endonuclease McrA
MRNYNDPAYKKFRMDVLKRDKFTCKMCKTKKKKVYVHHIRKWASASSLRYETSNGITLCYNCHKEVTGKEHHYESYLLGLIDG